jgi:hypothetical protein
MKGLMIALIAVVSISVLAGNDPVIYTTVDQDTYDTFYDSAFFYNEDYHPEMTHMCLVGDDPEHICRLIRAQVNDINLEYSQGAHDNLELHMCRGGMDYFTKKPILYVVYDLIDDYSPEPIRVERVIRHCRFIR